MATCQITEYEHLAKDAYGNLVPIGAKMIAEQSVTYTSSTQSNAMNVKTKFIRVSSSAAAHLAFGSNPTATASNIRVAANVPEYISVTGGEEVAVYDGST